MSYTKPYDPLKSLASDSSLLRGLLTCCRRDLFTQTTSSRGRTDGGLLSLWRTR